MSKKRIDVVLLERGLAESRHKAQALLIAGQVLVEGQKIEKSGRLVSPDAEIRILQPPRFASRAGAKLQAALSHFQIQVSGRVCVDLGASTGGFTDCLLQNGAREVHAYDVGKGLLDWKLRSDPRVVIHDEFNVRYLTAADLPAGASLVTADLSFISLTKILTPLRDALLPATEAADVVLLVKPQFEVGKGEVGKGGIVRSPEKQERAVRDVSEFAAAAGYKVRGAMASPVPGSKGNLEFLLYLQLFPDLSSRA
jgi:23S rRNA (cytidine1920-2'-O)/16S rRNA (cytidine1409-2'-O)-methyltransferase